MIWGEQPFPASREIRAPCWQQLSGLQLLPGALLSPNWQGPKNEYLTIEIYIECAEKARHYNSTVRKEDISKWSDSIS